MLEFTKVSETLWNVDDPSGFRVATIGRYREGAEWRALPVDTGGWNVSQLEQLTNFLKELNS